ncbi:hypothetical protein [Rhodospirillaceae bacterium SYSU D60014]|uniref:hypothetical protein n=1 Tax=Virgifigura deserti TaxID=2268457 RepID=UPI0013C4300A
MSASGRSAIIGPHRALTPALTMGFEQQALRNDVHHLAGGFNETIYRILESLLNANRKAAGENASNESFERSTSGELPGPIDRAQNGTRWRARTGLPVWTERSIVERGEDSMMTASRLLDARHRDSLSEVLSEEPRASSR